jgi:hypothetical protein
VDLFSGHRRNGYVAIPAVDPAIQIARLADKSFFSDLQDRLKLTPKKRQGSNTLTFPLQPHAFEAKVCK